MQLQQVPENKFKRWRFSDFFTLLILLWMNGGTAASKLICLLIWNVLQLGLECLSKKKKRFHFPLNFVYPKFYM